MNARIDVAVATLLLGTAFAGAGWLVTHFVENIVSAPTVEYDEKYDEILDPEIAECCSAGSNSVITIHNLSRTKKLSAVEVILRLRDTEGKKKSPDKFMCAKMDSIPPSLSSGDPITRSDYSVSSPDLEIHPGTAFRVIACYGGDEKPTLHFASKEAVRAVAKGPLTWLIRHEITVLLALLVIWIAAAFLVLAYSAFGGGRD